MKGLNKVRNKSLAVALLFVSALMLFTGCNGKKKDNKPQIFSYEIFNHSKGLPYENITSIAALGDKICAGSKKGLFIYDGVNWEINNKSNNNSLGSDEIVGIQEQNNCLWIATDNGACYYNGNTFQSVYTGGRARAVSGTGTSNYAVGTAYGVIINGSNSGSEVASNEISALMYDKRGNLWAGTRTGGVYEINGSSARNFRGQAKSIQGSALIDIPAVPANCKLPGNLIKAMIPYNGFIAVGTTGGLCITDFSSVYKVYTALHDDYFQRNGKIVKEEVPGNCKIPGNKVLALASTDKDELLFVVTDQGLGILKGEEWLDIEKTIPGLPSTGLTSVAWCKNDLWIGMEEGIIKVSNLSSLYANDDAK